MTIPWWAKMGAKLILSRMPVRYRNWARLGIFRHGHMADLNYARGVFEFHMETMPAPAHGLVTCLEIGPGDSLLTSVMAATNGFARTILVDAGDFADRSLAPLQAAAKAGQLPEHRFAAWTTVEAALADLQAIYLTQGLASLRSLPDESVDLAFSQAVLEHVRKAEYPEFLRELRRVLKPGGTTSHQVDLQDHLQHGLNNLRFPDRIWESSLFANSGFYTNRLSLTEHRAAFEAAGLKVTRLELQHFEQVPIKRESLSRQFADRSLADLAVRGFHLVATK